MTIHISRRAAFDLDEIDQYSINKWGKKVADDYMESLDLALQTLEKHPNLLREKTKSSAVFSLYRVREHYLVCSLINQNIIMLTVKSGSLDLLTRLSELEPTLIKEAEFLHSQLSKT
jgi:plasmid stabilization system protein ParE